MGIEGTDHQSIATDSLTNDDARLTEPPGKLVAYVILIGLLAVIGLVLLVDAVPHQTNINGENYDHWLHHNGQKVFCFTLGMMACCGILGGSLFDLRGIIKHSMLRDYDPRFNLSYLLRPLTGAITGVIAFFLLLGGVLAFSTHNVSHGAAWTTFSGRMPFLAVAILAGYSSQVFMMKLKDISDAIFSPKGLSEHEKGSQRREP